MKSGSLARVYAASVRCLDDELIFEKWLCEVPAARREKAGGLKNAEAKKRSLGAGALLVCALRDYLEKDAGKSEPHRNLCRFLKTDSVRHLRIAEKEHGKPYLPDFDDIRFSLSHSGDRVMCTVSDVEVGCDVERVPSSQKDVNITAAGGLINSDSSERTGTDIRDNVRRRERNRIEYVSRYFTEAERQVSLADAKDFYRIWTLKESFLKMTGSGLRQRLDSFEVTFDPPKIKQNIIKGDIVCRDFGCIDGYQYACVTAGGQIADAITWVDLRQERENEGNTAESHEEISRKIEKGFTGNGG